MKWRIFALTILLVFSAFRSVSKADTTQTSVTSVRRNIATVILAGIGGAVLGISTLTFYGDPQNHIGNITTGFALGLVGGATYVAVQSADSMRQQMALDPLQELRQRGQPSKPAVYAFKWDF